MKTFLKDHLAISLYTGTCAAIIVIATWYVHRVEQQFVFAINTNIKMHTEALKQLALLTDNNDADGVVNAIIHDCPKRNDFDAMLGNLNTASKRDLITTQQLFESCGSFYTVRKAFMVARMDQEYASLKENVDLLRLYEDLDETAMRALRINELITLERKRSELLNEQMTLQGEIIQYLIVGTDESTAAIKKNVASAQVIQQVLTRIDKEAGVLQQELFP